MNPSLNHLFNSQRRGAAMAEGVIALPVLVLLFVGIFYVRDMVTKRQDVDTLARSCAWRYAANGCVEEPVGCDALGLLEETPFEAQGADFIKSQGKDLESAIANAGDSGGGDQVAGAVWGLVSPILAEALTSAATATPSTTLKAPRLFGGQERLIEGHFQLSCNLQKKTAVEIAVDMWTRIDP